MIRIAVALCAVASLLLASAASAQGGTDPEITFAAPATVSEGDDGYTDVAVTWQLSAASETTISFDVEVPADTDTPADWEELPHTPVLVPPGTTGGSFTVRIVGDLLVEATESFGVYVWNITGARTGGHEAQTSVTIMIEDDDAPAATPWIVRDDFLVPRQAREPLAPWANDTLETQSALNATWTLVEPPLNGVVDVDAFGLPVYVAAPDFQGMDSLRFRVCLADGGECRESTYTIELVPFAGGLFGGQGRAGHERREASRFPAIMPSPRWRATPLYAPERVRLYAGPDPTPATPWDGDDGTAFLLRTLPAADGEPVVHRIDVYLNGLTDYERQDLFVGVDTDGDGRPSAGETRCTDGDRADIECRMRVVVGDTPLSYWVMTHSRVQTGADAEAEVLFWDVPLLDGDGSLTVTGPGVLAADGTAPLTYAWDDRRMRYGDWYRGYLRIESEPGVPVGEIVVSVVNDGIDSVAPDALPLASGEPVRLVLDPARPESRVFVDVPAGATSLTVSSASAADVDFYVARHDAAIDPALVRVPAAPPASAATAVADGPGGHETVTIAGGALAPGRWYVVPSAKDGGAADVELLATVEALAPRVRSGSYFNAARSGSGLFLYPAGDQLTGLWYTYADDGRPTWYWLQAPAPGDDGLWSTPVWRAAWDGDDRTLTAVGRATVTPTDADAFTFSYVLDGDTGTQPYAALGRGCPSHGGAPVDISNQWFDPARAGTGYSVQTWPGYEYFAAYVYDTLGQPMFLAAELDRWGGDEAVLTLQRLRGTPPTRDAYSLQREDVGTFVRRLSGGALAQIEIDALWTEAEGDDPSTWSQVDAVQPLGGEGTSQGCDP